MFINDQKENRGNISKELLDHTNIDENFLENIVTGDETWVCGYDVEIKMQSSQWMEKGSPWSKKSTHGSVYYKGDVGVFFYLRDLIHYELNSRD